MISWMNVVSSHTFFIGSLPNVDMQLIQLKLKKKPMKK